MCYESDIMILCYTAVVVETPLLLPTETTEEKKEKEKGDLVSISDLIGSLSCCTKPTPITSSSARSLVTSIVSLTVRLSDVYFVFKLVMLVSNR